MTGILKYCVTKYSLIFQALAEHVSVPFLGEIPIDPNLAMAAEKGQNFTQAFQNSPASKAFEEIVSKL